MIHATNLRDKADVAGEREVPATIARFDLVDLALLAWSNKRGVTGGRAGGGAGGVVVKTSTACEAREIDLTPYQN